MKVLPVKGTRDFYPEQMAVRNFIIEGWKKISVINGFREYDGPILEYLKMFQIKSGEEIVEQLFSLKDRKQRKLAIRPEITPTLARMVNQKINSLPKPIKWFSVPRLCRAERPQKGRLREFFQWNIDIIGEDNVLADAEVIFTTVHYLQSVGLSPEDVKVKISSRKLLAEVLKALGIPENKLDTIYPVLDKKPKLPSDTFDQMLVEQITDKKAVNKIKSFMELDNVSGTKKIIEPNKTIQKATEEIEILMNYLNLMQITDYCRFDPAIVRGLAYYTGIVFEVHDADQQLRAIGGGGRYDNLLQDFGGPTISATGMGMGDCVLELLLRQKGLITDKITEQAIDFFVACADKSLQKEAYRLTAELRRRGLSTNFNYNPGKALAKQLKEASAQNAKKCIIIGQEFRQGNLLVKDMATGKQHTTLMDQFLLKLNECNK